MNDLKNLSILIVDDEPLIREILEFEIQNLGGTTTLAENGVIAFELIQKNKFDVVISDVTMPGGDGIKLAELISKLSEPKPVVFLCSGFGDNTVEKAKELGVSEIFAKPFDREYMAKAIQKAIATKTT